MGHVECTVCHAPIGESAGKLTSFGPDFITSHTLQSTKNKGKEILTKDKIETQHSISSNWQAPTLVQRRIHSKKISGCNATIFK